MVNTPLSLEKLDGITLNETRKGKTRLGYENINVHIIFDISMDGRLSTKSILVAEGHTTTSPQYMTYSSVVTTKSVSIAFIIDPSNDLEIFTCDIGNAYLNVNRREKLWT